MTDQPSWLHGTETIRGIRTVALAGELDMADSDALRQLLFDDLAAPGVMCVIVDLSRVSFIDSSIINAFIAAYRNAEETGVHFRVSHPQTRIRDILDVVGVLYLLMPRS